MSCAVSDPNDNPNFIAKCNNKHTSIRCEKCDMIYDTIDVMMNLMEKYRDDGILSRYEAAVIYKRLTDAQVAIYQHQIHMIKVFSQEDVWTKLIEERDPSVAFYEGDWGMKILPRRYRGKQSEWFGLNGMSNHIGCFTKIIPKSYKEDGTPKVYEKVVDTYASIVKDSAKQDALTSAAIIKENIIAFKKNNPDVKKLYLRSDNAGCYKNSKLIQALYSISNDIEDLEIMGDFFDESWL